MGTRTLNNYRVTFGGQEIDYKDDFVSCKQYLPVLKKLYDLLEDYAIEDCWHFFEPYVEFTWVVPQSMMDTVLPLRSRDPITLAEDLMETVLLMLKQEGIEPITIHRPTDGQVAGWFHKSPEELEFEYKTYAASARMAMLFYEYQKTIDEGCGERNQFMRRPHVLANQLAMNYDEEGKALNQRGRLCELFWEHGHEEAVRRYEEEFKEKYL